MIVKEKIRRIQNKILDLYDAIDSCTSPFFRECMFHCIEKEKDKIRKLKQYKYI